MSFEQATPKKKRFKVLFWGPPGCYKTRTILRLGHIAEPAVPVLAMVDMEFGSDHYADEFNFIVNQELDPNIIDADIKKLVAAPGNTKIIGIDGWSVYHDQVKNKFLDLFLKREIRSPGHKEEYYTLQPRDYDPINRQVHRLVRLLLKSDMHVLATCQQKDKWEGMKVTGVDMDGPKRISYYFDTIIEIQEAKSGQWKAFVRGKDRSGVFKVNEEIPWGNDKEAADFLESKWGNLTVGPGASPLIIQDEIIDTTSVNIPDPPDPVKEAATKAAAATESTNDLLWAISNLKKELKIPTEEWLRLLIPFGVPSAKVLTELQLVDLKHKLEAMRPTQAAQAA